MLRERGEKGEEGVDAKLSKPILSRSARDDYDVKSPEGSVYLNRKLSVLEKDQKTCVKVRTLPDGRIRYYQKERGARTLGFTRGNSKVTEYNPKTGTVRLWMESYDHSGVVTRVHPKSINGVILNKPHYPPTKFEIERANNEK